MKFQIVAVRDIKADCFSHPQFVANLGSAIRSFGDACLNKDHDLGKHPEDYELYHLGEYDDQDGAFLGVTGTQIEAADKHQIAVGSNYIQR